MKNFILLLLITPSILICQCISGDCNNGVGTYIYSDGSIYDGAHKNGLPNGIGSVVLYDEDGILLGIYNGEYENGERTGWGTEVLYSSKGYMIGTYVGEWENNDYNGWGIFIHRDKSIEKGLWKDSDLVK